MAEEAGAFTGPRKGVAVGFMGPTGDLPRPWQIREAPLGSSPAAPAGARFDPERPDAAIRPRSPNRLTKSVFERVAPASPAHHLGRRLERPRLARGAGA